MNPATTWIEAIKIIHPDFDDLMFEMKKENCYFPPMLTEKSTGYILTLVYDNNTVDYTKLSIVFDWIHTQIINWPNAVIYKPNAWLFKNKDDANKFLTLYRLKWAI